LNDFYFSFNRNSLKAALDNSELFEKRTVIAKNAELIIRKGINTSKIDILYLFNNVKLNNILAKNIIVRGNVVKGMVENNDKSGTFKDFVNRLLEDIRAKIELLDLSVTDNQGIGTNSYFEYVSDFSGGATNFYFPFSNLRTEPNKELSMYYRKGGYLIVVVQHNEFPFIFKPFDIHIINSC
jgi:type II secretory pathway component GspD/PulD (secretin)